MFVMRDWGDPARWRREIVIKWIALECVRWITLQNILGEKIAEKCNSKNSCFYLDMMHIKEFGAKLILQYKYILTFECSKLQNMCPKIIKIQS